MSDTELSRIRGFDGLRAVAVTGVFLEHHVIHGMGLGGLGVWLFFALSGYLIIRILHNQRLQVEKGGSTVGAELVRFWRRRALRIFPLYYLVLGVIAVWLLSRGERFSDTGLLWYIAYLSNFLISFGNQNWSDYSHLWSLSVEQQFYTLAAPALLLVAIALHARLLWLVLGFACLSLLLQSLLMDDATPISLMPMQNFGLMAIGGLIALEGHHLKWSPRAWNMMLLVALACGVLVLAMTRYGNNALPAFAAAKYLPAYIFAFGVIGFVSLNQRHWIASLLSLRWIAYLGTISYGFYVFHYFAPSHAVLSRLIPLPELPQAVLNNWFVVQYALTLAVSAASWHLLEKPLLQLRGDRVGKSPNPLHSRASRLPQTGG